MSLRIRLNLLISVLFVSLFICSSFYIIANARTVVKNETESTAQLALQLIQIAISSSEPDRNSHTELLDKLSTLDKTRHLRIDIQSPSEVVSLIKRDDETRQIHSPAWFIKLVKPPQVELRRWIYSPMIPPTGIIIQTDPIDEIEEIWAEVKSVLSFLFMFILLSNILVYLAVGYYLSPIDKILDALSIIEKGNYKIKLPGFRLPELDRISRQFNHMVGVLSASRTENKLLTQQSLQIQEEERRHLAQELHDELGQTLTAIKAVAVSIKSDGRIKSDHIDNSVKTIVEYSDHIYKVAKNMMHRLRPSVLDEFGLIRALQNMIDDWNSRQDDVFCHFQFEKISDNLSGSLKINLFRIVQESLTNVLKHAAASEVTIDIKQFNNVIELVMHDNGKGLAAGSTHSGLGMLGINERVEMHKGKLELTSAVGQGLRIEITIPLAVEGNCDA